MKYLVLKTIRAFGKRYERGAIIEEAQVRSPRILIGEHKITPVREDVSSSISPAVADTKPVEAEAKVSEEPVEVSVPQQEEKEVKKPVRLSFAKEG